MTFSPHDALQALEHSSESRNLDDFYLWPRTIIGDKIQAKVIERVGVGDEQIDNKHSRSARIIKQIQRLIAYRLLSLNFSIVDIACGDAIVLWQIKKACPAAFCYGIDCNKGKFSIHDRIQRDGVLLYKGFIQDFFQMDIKPPFDVSMMLNTYRGWESADLRPHEQSLPLLADGWFANCSRYTILTATAQQISDWQQRGFTVAQMGRGEDNSTMICVSKFALPRSLRQQFYVFRQNVKSCSQHLKQDFLKKGRFLSF